MTRRAVQSESEVCAVLLETYGANDCMNQLLLEHLDARAWRASPEGKNRREARTVAGIFTHLHNNRLSWIKNSAPHLKCLRRSPPRVARACRHTQLTGKAQHEPIIGAGDHASTSTGLQAARQGHVWDLMVAEVLEAVRL
jgi:hypothetical protein